MRTKGVVITGLCAVILILAGIAAAEPCPAKSDSHKIVYNGVAFHKSVIGNIETYFLDTVNINNAGVIELCIYPKAPGFPNNGILTPLYDDQSSLLWKIANPTKNDYLGFVRKNGQNNIPINGRINIRVGTADYKTSPSGLLEEGGVLLHIDDPNECKVDKENDGTCFRRPGITQKPTPTPTSAIPEFPTVAFPVAALLGLVSFFAYRKKEKE